MADTSPKETGIPCWRCSLRSGTDCPGREEKEATLCNPCFQVHILEMYTDQAKHYLSLLDSGYLSLDQFLSFMDDLMGDLAEPIEY